MNKSILQGRITRDLEIRYSNASEPVALLSFNLAVNRKFKKDGQPEADFINCKAFGKTAENIEKFFKKGSLILITGRIQTGSYDKDGQKIYTTDVIVEEFDFTGEKKDGQATEKDDLEPQYDKNGNLIDDELPFN